MNPAQLKKALAAALAAMDELLAQTVDSDLAHGIELTTGEKAARKKCLAVFAKYGPEYQPEFRGVEA